MWTQQVKILIYWKNTHTEQEHVASINTPTVKHIGANYGTTLNKTSVYLKQNYNIVVLLCSYINILL